MQAPRIRIREIELYERLTPFARPFRFGSTVVDTASQAFVRVAIEAEGYGVATGASAEMMMPKWFDKRPEKSAAETVADLRVSLAHAAGLYLDLRSSETAFALHAAVIAQQIRWAEKSDLPALAAGYGPAVIDKAILDALLNALDMNLVEGLRANVCGLDARLTPDLSDARIGNWLQAINPTPFVAIRHTIGLVDDLQRLAEPLLESNIKFLKIKIGGDVSSDVERLRMVSCALSSCERPVYVTLDANEQYDEARLPELLAVLSEDRSLALIRNHLLYIEQPFDRATTMAIAIRDNWRKHAFIIDEADDSYGAYPRAAELGYRGVSSKSCKGLYKSILNTIRASEWNAREESAGRYFISGEDLTCQAGLAVQQDTALAAVLGLEHVERNGHFYVEGFGPAPAREAAAFATAYPDYYYSIGNQHRLVTSSGGFPTAPLFSSHGFASRAEPDWRSLSPLPFASARVERTYA